MLLNSKLEVNCMASKTKITPQACSVKAFRSEILSKFLSKVIFLAGLMLSEKYL